MTCMVTVLEPNRWGADSVALVEDRSRFSGARGFTADVVELAAWAAVVGVTGTAEVTAAWLKAAAAVGAAAGPADWASAGVND